MSRSECPCGSGDGYDDCCGTFHRGEALPATPETLMRARYSAFARGLEDYLRDTWHPATLPDGALTDPLTRWIGLDILDAPAPEPKRAIVEFVARYRADGAEQSIHERSRFVWQSERWWYLKGTHFADG